MSSYLSLTLLPVSLSLVACHKDPAQAHCVTVEANTVKRQPCAQAPGQALASFAGGVDLLQASVQPARLKPGDTVILKLRFLARQDLFEDWRIFVHGQLKGAELTQLQDDHEALDGLFATGQWRRGDVIEEQRQIKIPAGLVGKTLEFYLGFYRGKQRMAVTRGDSDGNNRLKIGAVELQGGVDLPSVRAAPIKQVIKIDGVLDEPAWSGAQRVGPFVHYHGRGVPSNATHARLLYDDKALYIGFECDDADIWTTYTKRDDPIYNQEAVEIFIDVDGDLDDYVELQCAPNNVHFDAAFHGGRRKNMDTAYNADYQTAVKIDGTLGDGADRDRGWVAEWRIPFDQIRGCDGPPKPGDKWRINLFRLDKVRKGGRVVENQASAWSSPLSGDFHHLQRFGWLYF